MNGALQTTLYTNAVVVAYLLLGACAACQGYAYALVQPALVLDHNIGQELQGQKGQTEYTSTYRRGIRQRQQATGVINLIFLMAFPRDEGPFKLACMGN